MKRLIWLGIYLVIIFVIINLKYIDKLMYKQTNQHALRKDTLVKPIVTETETDVDPLPNDPALFKNWGLYKSINRADINVQNAWKISRGSRSVIVAIIDTGIDYNHPDIAANLWKNSGETGVDSRGNRKENNGLDDDGNGFIDDVIGWDFVKNDPLPYDTHGHGTHVAGIIGAVGGNGIGTSGVCPHVSLMILKYYNPNASGQENLENTIKAVKYATANGAQIINYSGGGPEYSYEEEAAIKEALNKNILFVAAAGNEQQNSDQYYYYPAAYGLKNVISVASITNQHILADSSNYGITKVDVAAPGENIYSTLPKNNYGTMSGTSQATAFVTGVAALVLAKGKQLRASEIKQYLLDSVDKIPSLRGKIKTAGKINAYAALIQLKEKSRIR